LIWLAILSDGGSLRRRDIELYRRAARDARAAAVGLYSVFYYAAARWLGSAGLVLEPRRMAGVRGADRGGEAITIAVAVAPVAAGFKT